MRQIQHKELNSWLDMGIAALQQRLLQCRQGQRGPHRRYLHAWRLGLVVVQAWISAHEAAHLFDNFFGVLDKVLEVYEHHAARNPLSKQIALKTIAANHEGASTHNCACSHHSEHCSFRLDQFVNISWMLRHARMDENLGVVKHYSSNVV